MSISIIIPNYNSQDTILKTLKSIYETKIIKKEIIVVDNNSLDNSIKLIKKKYSNVKILKLNENYGASKARNTGFNNASNEKIIFIDSDMWFENNSFINLITQLDFYDIVFPKIIYENQTLMYPIFENEKKYPLISGCFGINKKSLKKLDEIFDEYYETYLEDYDFFIRCKFSGLKANYIQNCTVIHENKNIKVDYSKRYFLEIRNLLYGKKKYGNFVKKTKLYNPFTYFNFIKIIMFGIINFAWFNWYKNDRSLSYFKKINILHTNPIFINKNNWLKLLIKSLKRIKNDNLIIKKKRKKIKFFYSHQ